MKKPIIAIATALVVSAFAAFALGETPGAANTRPPFALANASPSPDDLIKRLLAALEKNDDAALHSLRMSEREYREIIAPGTVQPGQPPRQTDPKIMDFYWSMLNAKSHDLGRELLRAYGGRKLEVVKIEYVRGEKDYAWYRAIGEPRIRVRNEEGKEAVVPAGYVAEVEGRYKFIGLDWED